MSKTPLSEQTKAAPPKSGYWWWLWPALATVLAVVSILSLFPGLGALRTFESQNAAWINDQARRNTFREDAEKEQRAFEQAVADHQTKLADLQSKSSVAEEQLKTQQPLLSQLEQARRDLTNAKQERLAAESAREAAIRESESLATAVKTLQSQQQSLSTVVSELKTLQAERDQISKDLTSLTQNLSQARTNLSGTTDQFVQAKSELAVLQTSRANEEAKLQAIRDNAQQAAVLDSQIQQKQQQVDRLKSDTTSLQQRLQGLQMDLDDELKRAASARDTRKKEIDAEVKKLTDARDTLTVERSTLADQVAAGKSQLADLLAKVDRAKTDAATQAKASSEVERLSGQERDLRARVTSLDEQIKASTGTLGSLRDEEAKLRQQIQTLLSDQQSTVTRLQGLAPLLGATFDALSQQIKKFNQQSPPPADAGKQPEGKP